MVFFMHKYANIFWIKGVYVRYVTKVVNHKAIERMCLPFCKSLHPNYDKAKSLSGDLLQHLFPDSWLKFTLQSQLTKLAPSDRTQSSNKRLCNPFLCHWKPVKHLTNLFCTRSTEAVYSNPTCCCVQLTIQKNNFYVRLSIYHLLLRAQFNTPL